MILAVVAALTVGIFTVSLFFSGLIGVGKRSMEIAHRAFGAMRDPGLSDEQRESLVQKASGQLAVAFVSIAVRFAVALAVAFVPIWAFDVAGIVAIGETTSYLARWDVIAVSTLVITIGLVAWHRLRNSR